MRAGPAQLFTGTANLLHEQSVGVRIGGYKFTHAVTWQFSDKRRAKRHCCGGAESGLVIAQLLAQLQSTSATGRLVSAFAVAAWARCCAGPSRPVTVPASLTARIHELLAAGLPSQPTPGMVRFGLPFDLIRSCRDHVALLQHQHVAFLWLRCNGVIAVLARVSSKCTVSKLPALSSSRYPLLYNSSQALRCSRFCSPT